MLKSFIVDESGATMIEYGLIAALVSVAAIAMLEILGTKLVVIFSTVAVKLAAAASTAATP